MDKRRFAGRVVCMAILDLDAGVESGDEEARCKREERGGKS
jgi:hypothetical protein